MKIDEKRKSASQPIGETTFLLQIRNKINVENPHQKELMLSITKQLNDFGNGQNETPNLLMIKRMNG